MKVRNGFTAPLLLTQLTLTATMAGVPCVAFPHDPTASMQEATESQDSGTPSRVFPAPSQELSQSRAQQSPKSAPPGKSQKVQRWTGTLVDAGCMTNALSRFPSAGEALFPDPLSDFWQTLTVESSQRERQERKTGAWSPQSQPQTSSQVAWTGVSDGEPEASQQQIAMQTAQLKRAKMFEQAVKACTPTQLATHYGLVVSAGRLLLFDTGGDFKARGAIDVSAVEPGKTLMARVTGVTQAADNLRVASIEIKNRIPAPLVSSGR